MTRRLLNEPTTCTKCGKILPWSPEFFVGTSRKGYPVGCQQPCRECANAYGRKRHQDNKEVQKVQKKQWRARNKEEIKLSAHKYYEAHKDHHNAITREYHETHKDILKLKCLEWNNNHEAQRRTTSKVWYEAHKDQKIVSARDWKRKNPLAGRINNHRRRVLIKKAIGILTKADIELQYKNQKGQCWWCGVKLSEKYHIDHRVPLSKGGLHDRSNVVLSCAHCNQSKGARLPQEWAGRLF